MWKWPGLRAVHGSPVFVGREGTSQRTYRYREAVLQIATLAELHLSYGWPLSSLEYESGPPDWYFDLLIFDEPDNNSLVMAVDTKPTPGALEEPMRELEECASRDSHLEGDCGHNQHGKYEGLRSLRPSYFLAV